MTKKPTFPDDKNQRTKQIGVPTPVAYQAKKQQYTSNIHTSLFLS